MKKALKQGRRQSIDNENYLTDVGRVSAVAFENNVGASLTEDSDMSGLSTITLTGGAAVAQDADFYFPVDSVNVNEQIVIKCVLDSAVVINSIEFQTYVFGAWISDGAYSAGPVAADGSSHQYFTSMFPLRDAMNIGNKHRIRVNVAGDCVVGCVGMAEAL